MGKVSMTNTEAPENDSILTTETTQIKRDLGSGRSRGITQKREPNK